MSTFLSELGGLTEGVGAEALAFAAGFAAARALEPAAVSLSQDAFHAAQTKRLDPGTAAEAAAENYAHFDTMQAEASYSGYDSTRFAYIYDVTLTAPGLGQLLTMLRRGTINPGNFSHGLRKAKLEPMWDAALAELQTVRLTPQELALGIVRSTVKDPGLLVVSLDTQGSTIPKYPTWPGDTLQEAAAGGVDADRLRAMVGAVGLPMSPQQAASATFRQIINRQAFNLSILEGDVRPEYADAIFEQARQILTAGEYAELQLRGYYDRATRLANTAKHGMSDADSDLLYNVLGRGLSLHAAFVAERRGGVFNGPTDAIPDWAMFQLQRGNLRPEVYNLAWAGRETFPSYFVTRALLQAGAITAERGQELFDGLGWPEDVAKAAGQTFATGTGSTADPHVTKAENHVWTVVQSSYEKDRTDDAEATAALTKLGVATDAIPQVLALWQISRGITRAGLSAAQIKKAYGEATFTQPEAVARLVELGWSAADAAVYLGE